MTRQESPSVILNSILARTAGALLVMAAIPFAILGMLAFDICDGIRESRAWCWIVGRRV